MFELDGKNCLVYMAPVRSTIRGDDFQMCLRFQATFLNPGNQALELSREFFTQSSRPLPPFAGPGDVTLAPRLAPPALSKSKRLTQDPVIIHCSTRLVGKSH